MPELQTPAVGALFKQPMFRLGHALNQEHFPLPIGFYARDNSFDS